MSKSDEPGQRNLTCDRTRRKKEPKNEPAVLRNARKRGSSRNGPAEKNAEQNRRPISPNPARCVKKTEASISGTQKNEMVIQSKLIFLDDNSSNDELAQPEFSNKLLMNIHNPGRDSSNFTKSEVIEKFEPGKARAHNLGERDLLGKRDRRNVFDDFLYHHQQNLKFNFESDKNRVKSNRLSDSKSLWKPSKRSFPNRRQMEASASSNFRSPLLFNEDPKRHDLNDFMPRETPNLISCDIKDELRVHSKEPFEFSGANAQLRSEESNLFQNYVRNFVNRPARNEASFEPTRLSEDAELRLRRRATLDRIEMSKYVEQAIKCRSHGNKQLQPQVSNLNFENRDGERRPLEVGEKALVQEFHPKSTNNPRIEIDEFRQRFGKNRKKAKAAQTWNLNQRHRGAQAESGRHEHFGAEADVDTYRRLYERLYRHYKMLENQIQMLKFDMKTIGDKMSGIRALIEESNALSVSSKQTILRQMERAHPKPKPLEINLNLNLKNYVISEKNLIYPILRESDPICLRRCRGAKPQSKPKKSPSAAERMNQGRIPYSSGESREYVLVKFKPEKTRKEFELDPAVALHFKELSVVLKKLFWNEPVCQSQLDSLRARDRKIISAILKKKKIINEASRVSFRVKEFNEIIQKRGKKRTEENLKFVFKYTQKFLRIQFRKRNNEFSFRKVDTKESQKNLIDLGFYTYYFGQIADELGWPISKFFHPKVLSHRQSNDNFLESPEERPKTINKEYINNLKRSPAFIKDMSQFLHGEYLTVDDQKTGIIEKFKSSIELKIMHKLDHWYKLIYLKNQGNGLEKIIKDLQKNQKSKLPWSIIEMTRAVEETLNYFSTDTSKKINSR